MLYQPINNDITIKQVINDILAQRKKSWYWLALQVYKVNSRRKLAATKCCIERFLTGKTKSIHSAYLDDIFKVLNLHLISDNSFKAKSL